MLSMRAGHKRENPDSSCRGSFPVGYSIGTWSTLFQNHVQVSERFFVVFETSRPAIRQRVDASSLFKLKVPRFLRLDHGLSAARRLAGVKGIRLAFGAVKHVQEPC